MQSFFYVNIFSSWDIQGGIVFSRLIYSLLWGAPTYIGTEIIPTTPDLGNASEGTEENREVPIEIGTSFCPYLRLQGVIHRQ